MHKNGGSHYKGSRLFSGDLRFTISLSPRMDKNGCGEGRHPLKYAMHGLVILYYPIRRCGLNYTDALSLIMERNK